MSERVISVALVAFGIGLEDLAARGLAATGKEADILVGNIAGSNLFNIIAVLIIASIFEAIKVNPQVVRDILWMLAVSILLTLFF